jgi:hypothetical protein
LTTEHGATLAGGSAVFLRPLLKALALVGFVVFLARCAIPAAAQETPLSLSFSPWVGFAHPGMTYSYSASVFSSAATPSIVTVRMDLDRRLTALPDHRTENCIGTRPVVCTVSVYVGHPAILTFSVRVNDGVCGPYLQASAFAADDRGITRSLARSVSLDGGRCVLFLPVAKR